MRNKLAASAAFGLLLLWACHLSPEDAKDHFDVVGDSAWIRCDTVLVVLKDDAGKILDTLFNDSLRFLSQLKRLSAEKYPGGEASLSISGRKDGESCFEQTRSFDEKGTVGVDTVLDPGSRPLAVAADPESLSLLLGGAGRSVKGTVSPAHADQALLWRLAGDGVVSLGIPAGGGSGPVTVKPEKIGFTKVTLRSAKDTGKFVEIKVQVTAPPGASVSLNRDSLRLYAGGEGDSLAAEVLPAAADQKVEWKTLNPNVATVDSRGRVKPVGEGQTYVQARSLSNLQYGSAWVTVRRDIPRLTLDSRKGAGVNTDIVITPRTVQEYGVIELLLWDLDEDGKWDDSLPGPWIGLTAELPPITVKYAKEGLYTARFAVRDGEGNMAGAQVVLDIGNQAPEIEAIRPDTVISIRDSVAMTASIRDLDGRVAWVGWDYDGDGTYEDSLAVSDSQVEIVLGHRYPDAGIFLAVLQARDESGKARLDTVRVKVELDRPVADAGGDTAVTVGSDLFVHVRGADKHGRIVKREARFPGSAGYREVSAQDTVIRAPDAVGSYVVAVRVTDDDGLSDVDSAQVTVTLSADADLSGLVFSGGPLEPAFKPSISFYSARVNYGDSSVTVTPAAKDPSSKISVNARPVASGAASLPEKLQVGANLNVFQIVVTSADGTQRLYALSVVRDPSADATLGKLEAAGFSLKPAFSPSTLAYADTVANAVAYVSFKPTLAIPTASLTVNDSAMPSGTATFPMPLQVGENLFSIKVTSQSGAIQTVYGIKVIRRGVLVLLRSLDGKPATATDSSEVIPGSPLEINSPPVTGYRFVKWSLLEGAAAVLDPAANPTLLTPGPAKVRALADFVLNKYTITAGAGANGSIAPSGLISIGHGRDTSFAITPNAGYAARSVTVDGADVTSSVVKGVYAFKGVVADHSISVVFGKPGFFLIANAGPGGSITPASVTVDSLDTQEFTVTANPGYRVHVLQDNGVDITKSLVNGKYSISKVDKPHTLALTFKRVFTVNVSVAGGGTVKPGTVTLDSGASQTFALEPNPECKIASVLLDGSSVGLAASVAITAIKADRALSVTFRRTFAFTSSVKGSGFIEPAKATVDSGADTTILIKPNAGWRTSSLSLDGAAVAPSASVLLSKMGRNHVLDAVFTRFFHLTAGVAAGSGSITPASVDVDSGSGQTFVLSPAPNYRVAGITVNGVAEKISDTASRYVLPAVTKSFDIKVSYLRQYRVTVATDGRGAASASPALVDSGKASTITITPDPHYRVDSVFDNGTRVAASGGAWGAQTYAIGAVTADHGIRVVFRRYYELSAKVAGGSGTLTPESVNVDSLGSQVFTAKPAAGYYLADLTDNDAAVTPTGNEYLVANVTGNHGLVATFKQAKLGVLNLTSNAASTLKYQPTLCVEYSGTKPICKAGALSVEIPLGNTVLITADAEWCADDNPSCRAPLPFSGWQVEKGQVVKENPYKFAFEEGGLTLQANYSDAAGL